ncbi:MAG: hypothetical protein KBA32_07195 [Propionivibrio sp.]|jgi:hypothetical protein|nr:hypothetical protein [Propionivibrio sp.]MBP7202975.1 hypothetical protein [Propionivibrio sp.]
MKLAFPLQFGAACLSGAFVTNDAADIKQLQCQFGAVVEEVAQSTRECLY